MLWRCLRGSQTLEPDFRWGNKQQTKVPRNKGALLMQMGPGGEGGTQGLQWPVETLHCF